MSTQELKQSISKRDIWLICIAAFLMVATTTLQYFFMRDSMFNEATLRAKSELTVACKKIETAVTHVESAVNTMAYTLVSNTPESENIYDITIRLLKDNHDISKCVVALKDNAFAIGSLWEGDQIHRTRLPDSFLKEDWFLIAEKQKTPFWSEPFLENETLKARYVYPLVDRKGFFLGVLAVDVPTDHLTKEIKGLPEYPNSYAKLISEKGHKIIGPDDFTNEDRALHFTSPIGNVGWNLTVVCPESDINSNIEMQRIVVLILQCLSILLLLFILIKSIINIRKLRKATAEKERLSYELNSAQQVQKSMVLANPNILPQQKNLKVSVRMLNANEMSGDFYDCISQDDKLYFCIGDVAGSGAPAALTMAMTVSAFRTASRYSENPGILMNDINHSLYRKNVETTSVKMLCGVLNQQNGELRFCNAGMHSPILLTEDDYQEIEVEDNPRVGINANFEFKGQKTQIAEDCTLFLYTDGLTEAVNKKGTEWGIKHLTAQLSSTTRMNSEELLDRIEESISKHTKGAELLDDLTMMAIKYQLKDNND